MGASGMKATTTTSKMNRSSTSLSLELLPMACLLLVASALAIAGGPATATLFFGMLLVFAILVSICRSRLTSREES
jgi:amino acid permease